MKGSKEAQTTLKRTPYFQSPAMASAASALAEFVPPPPLTDEYKAAAAESWALVETLDPEVVGVMLFKNIFEIAPEAVQMFSFKDEPNMYESKSLKAHGARVVRTVGTAVAGLKDIEKLVPVLVGLGRKHVQYGVLPDHYGVVGMALMATLKAGLGDAFTPEVQAGWKAVYGTVAAVMIGDNYDVPTVDKLGEVVSKINAAYGMWWAPSGENSGKLSVKMRFDSPEFVAESKDSGDKVKTFTDESRSTLLAPGEGAVGRVFASKKTEFIPDVNALPATVEGFVRSELASKCGVKSIAFAYFGGGVFEYGSLEPWEEAPEF